MSCLKSKIKKASIAFRIPVSQWLSEERFQELLRLFQKYPGVTDEISFFTSEVHPPIPLQLIQERSRILAKRILAAKNLGFRAGINVLNTLGHLDESLDYTLRGNYTPITDINGKTCRGSFCPNDDNYRQYIRQVYLSVSRANPDHIWVDDDVRMANHSPVRYGCFCNRCLELFAKISGKKYTRKILQSAFNSGSLRQKLEMRRMWIRQNRNTIEQLLKLIEKTVHRTGPKISLGLMTGEMFYEGYNFDRWAEILAGPDKAKAEVRWRPGGGFYTDDALKGLIEKAHCIGRQVAFLPGKTVIQSEIENFTYQRLKKAASVTALESAAYIAAGCTGTAFNVLGHTEPLKEDEYGLLLAKLQATRPFFDLLAQNLGRLPNSGIYTGWNKDSFVTKNLIKGDWFDTDKKPGELYSHADELLAVGLPAAYAPEGAVVTTLCGKSVLAMKDDELKKILSSGVYLDAEALCQLNELGYQELTGFKVKRWVHRDCVEELTEDPLNEPFVGRKKDVRQSFWYRPAGMLESTAESSLNAANQTRVLAKAVNYFGKELAPCCMGIFENRLGGRVCVAGYYPWTYFHSLAKSCQIKAIMRWLSKDKLPGYISSFHRLNLWIREPSGTVSSPVRAVLINTSMDTAKNITLALRTGSKEVLVYDMNCSETKIRSSGKADGPYQNFVLPSLAPWQMFLVMNS